LSLYSNYYSQSFLNFETLIEEVKETTFYLNGNDTEELLAFGIDDEIFCDSGNNALLQFEGFYKKHQGEYIFGYFGYDLKNEIEDLQSKNKDFIGFPDLYFFVPKYVVKKDKDKFVYLQGKPNPQSTNFIDSFFDNHTLQTDEKIELKPQISKNEYLDTVEKLKKHLQHGDIYEVTFCQNFVAHDVDLNPKQTYFRLNQKTKAPMSCYVQINDHYLLSGSPERFLKKEKNKLISQPIKGTAGRASDSIQDEKVKSALLNDEKERAENVMIVDLVRNDLSRVAAKNSVTVEELFGVYTFPTVHQLISTISCEIKEGTTLKEIITALFPMGSMTGAPKISAMNLIEQYETFKRGLFSGAVGYFAPDGDFDFNVIIRSILYNSAEKVVSCPVGSAITIQSHPEKEYEECLIKVDAMRKILNGDV
jgi:para-aminobenzoate synthetase component 1